VNGAMCAINLKGGGPPDISKQWW